MEDLQSSKPNVQTITEQYVARFEKNKGCMIGDHIVSEFFPTITAVHQCIDPSGVTVTSYEVTVTDKSGNTQESVSVEDITRIDWFRDFGVCDIEMSKKDEKLLAYKLRKEAIECKNRQKEYQVTSGFHWIEGVPVVAMGDKIITPEDMDNSITITSVSRFKMKPERWASVPNYMIKGCIDFMPEVTVILFYSSLLGAIKPILNSFGAITDFIIALVAPSGHLKTTLTRLYALWLVQGEAQEISFSDTIRNDKFQRKVEAVASQNFLLDDYHATSKVYTKNKYRDRLDQAARIVSGIGNSANIFVTLESLKDSSIFSVADRMLQIYIRPMTDEELNDYKRKLSEIPQHAMSDIALKFVKKLLDNFEGVEAIVKDFLKKTTIPNWCKGSTRIGNQYRVLMLVESLFCKFMCGSNPGLSAHKKLDEALQVQGERQLKQLASLRHKDEDCNVLLALDEIITDGTKCTDIKIVLARTQYSDQTDDQAFLDGNCFYITGNALQTCLMKHIGYPVSLRKVSDDLHDAGVLIEDIDKRAKKFMSRRHYIISVDALKRYCEAFRQHYVF